MNDENLVEFRAFAVDTLVPAASAILKNTYDAYCDGQDISIESKADNSPASFADREAESVLRELIEAKYPDHGIWGEEYGTYNLEKDYVWILDPLDGTRAFLAKKPYHFGLLIGIFYESKPAFGLIHDPLKNEIWTNKFQQKAVKKDKGNISISCTWVTMFDSTPWKQKARDILARHTHVPMLNCMGFAKVADGEIDLAMEGDLALHDLAAIIPVLSASGAKIVDFDGQDYTKYNFDLPNAEGKKYNILCGLDHDLVDKTLKELQS